MKTPNKELTKKALDELQGLVLKAEELNKELKTAESDLVALEEEVRTTGEPDYRDDKAIQRLSALKLKADLCRKTVERFTAQVIVTHDSILEKLPEFTQIAAGILREVVATRRDTIARSLLPFSLSRTNAEDLAEQTDAYTSAAGRIGELSRLAESAKDRRDDQRRRGVPLNDGGYLTAAAQRIQAVLSEALKRSPDLMQFLPFQPAVSTEAQPQ